MKLILYQNNGKELCAISLSRNLSNNKCLKVYFLKTNLQKCKKTKQQKKAAKLIFYNIHCCFI